MAEWQDLQAELRRWRQAGRLATLWWRDDDAQADTPALQPLCQLSARYQVPVTLASIPLGCEFSLVQRVAREPKLWVAQHGFAHHNHAPADQRKCELGLHRPLAQVLEQLESGQQQLRQRFGDRFVPVLVPPWNRIASDVVAALPTAGFIGLSTLGPRPSATPLLQVNVHVDLIDWRNGRQFVGTARALAVLIEHLRQRREGEGVDPTEATGVMTHHLVQDEASWAFLDQLLRVCAEEGAHWCSLPELFPEPSAASDRL